MLLFMIAALGAYFIKGLCGFANTLIFGSILSFGVDNVNISPVDLLLGFPSNVILTWKNRKDLNRRVWMPLAALVLIGNIPGILLLKNTDAGWIKILFGVAVIGIALEMLLRETGQKKQHKSCSHKFKNQVNTDMVRYTGGAKVGLLFIGLLSGMLCGLYGVGALLAAYMSRVTDSNREFKANICAVFITENIFRIIVYSVTGILTFEVVRQAVLLVPVMLLGLWLGMKSASFLNEALVKKIVMIMLLFSGVSLILTNLPIF